MPDLYLKWNLPSTYQKVDSTKLLTRKTPEKSCFTLAPKEWVRISYPKYISFKKINIDDIIHTLDIEIITRIAMSKYVTIRQIREFMYLSGVCRSKSTIDKHLAKLVKWHIVRDCYIVQQEENRQSCSLHYFTLDKIGQEVAVNAGVEIHKGISSKKYKEDTPCDVKRVLMANQILLGLLKSEVCMERFGIMETFRSEDEDCYEYVQSVNAIFRTALNIKIDETSILAYEVVRDYSEAYIRLADKVKRYCNLLRDRQYLVNNYHGHKEVPQLIICGESFEHNCKIKKYLEEQKVMDEDVTILFTEDLFYMQECHQAIYEIDENHKRIWYELPTQKDNTKMTA